MACPVILMACTIFLPLEIWNAYGMDEFFVGGNMLLEVILLAIVLFNVVLFNTIFFTVVLFIDVAFIFSRAGTEDN